MATIIVCAALALIVLAIVLKLIRDRKAGKSPCACGGDCATCRACSGRPR